MTKKKKIGIVTLPPNINYGGILQSFALQYCIKKMGYEVESIEHYLWPKQLNAIQKIMLYPYRMVLKKIFHKKLGIRREECLYNAAQQQYYRKASYTMRFVEKYISRKMVYSFDEVQPGDYSAIVVGSDQIWRPLYANPVYITIGNMFLDFTKGWPIKRISYAPSFGTDSWEYSDEGTQIAKECIKKFDAVSCREKEGTEFCKTILGRPDAQTVVDPTMLVSKEIYEDLCKDIPKSEGGLFAYILDKNKDIESVLTNIQERQGFPLYEMSANLTEEGDAVCSVEQWLAAFRDAECVITDSFHACVFSIIFRKPFVVIGNKERGMVRYKTLLESLNLLDRIVTSKDLELICDKITTPLTVDDKILNRMISESCDFFNKHLPK